MYKNDCDLYPLSEQPLLSFAKLRNPIKNIKKKPLLSLLRCCNNIMYKTQEIEEKKNTLSLNNPLQGLRRGRLRK